MNAVIWVRQSKTQLALANISGAMMIQATVPGLGLLFTDWPWTAPSSGPASSPWQPSGTYSQRCAPTNALQHG
jgi:hypothetical protein